MDPISNTDRLILLLRQRLQERDRTRSGSKSTSRSDQTKAAGSVSTAQALAAIDGVDERQLRRTLIQGLLSDQFGDAMLNEPRFQQMVDRVVHAIEGDDAGRALLERMTAELRAAVRKA